jgi:solute carrier family 25 carnitine/acylcarnitine transporter 20/29
MYSRSSTATVVSRAFIVERVRRYLEVSSFESIKSSFFFSDIPSAAAYLAVYEYFKKLFAGEKGTDKLTPVAILLAGGFAGIADWVISLPADVLKSRLQTAPDDRYPNGIRDVFKEVIRTEGPTGLFRGLTPAILRAFPANAACLFGVEVGLWIGDRNVFIFRQRYRCLGCFRDRLVSCYR